jgi:hypothetical protein
LQRDPAWRDNLLFSEYFHGDNAAGLGAAHQTGWTGLIADVIRRRHGAVPDTSDLIANLYRGTDAGNLTWLVYVVSTLTCLAWPGFRSGTEPATPSPLPAPRSPPGMPGFDASPCDA